MFGKAKLDKRLRPWAHVKGERRRAELRLPEHATSSLDLANAHEHEIVMLVESMAPIPPPVPEALLGEDPSGVNDGTDRPRVRPLRPRETPTMEAETTPPGTTTMQGYQLWQ